MRLPSNMVCCFSFPVHPLVLKIIVKRRLPTPNMKSSAVTLPPFVLLRERMNKSKITKCQHPSSDARGVNSALFDHSASPAEGVPMPCVNPIFDMLSVHTICNGCVAARLKTFHILSVRLLEIEKTANHPSLHSAQFLLLDNCQFQTTCAPKKTASNHPL